MIGLIGISAAAVMGVMLKLLLTEGRLNLWGWSLLIVSGGLFLALFLSGLRWIDPEEREYLELLRGSGWMEESGDLAASARRMARQWLEHLLANGVEAEVSAASLPAVTRFLRRSRAQVLGDPGLLAQAAAYYGEVLAERLDGEWVRRRKAGYEDAVVRVGRGRNRHRISPGLLTFSVARDGETSLEGILNHELEEMSSGPPPPVPS